MKKNINDLERELILESIFIIGRVLSVEGRIVKIRVNKNKNRSHILYAGKTVKNVSVGSYVKIAKGFINIVGKVDGEYITEEKYFNRKYNKEEIKIINNNIDNQKQIYIAPKGDIQNRILYVKTKNAESEEKYFVVALNKPFNQDIQFTWWIIR